MVACDLSHGCDLNGLSSMRCGAFTLCLDVRWYRGADFASQASQHATARCIDRTNGNTQFLRGLFDGLSQDTGSPERFPGRYLNVLSNQFRSPLKRGPAHLNFKRVFGRNGMRFQAANHLRIARTAITRMPTAHTADRFVSDHRMQP